MEDDVPTYAYACTSCGHRFEAQQAFTDASLTECPECSGRLRKLFNTVGIVFKGSGFYRTDSRNGSGENGKGGDSGKGAEQGGGDKAAAKTSEGAGVGASANGSNGSSGGSGSGSAGSGSGSAGSGSGSGSSASKASTGSGTSAA